MSCIKRMPFIYHIDLYMNILKPSLFRGVKARLISILIFLNKLTW